MKRCIKSVKEELGLLAKFQNIDSLYIGVANAIAYYNNERIHTALKMSPRAYAQTIRKPKRLLNRVSGKVGA